MPGLKTRPKQKKSASGPGIVRPGPAMIGEEISFFPSKLFINPDIACRVYNVYSGIPINIVIARKECLSFQ